MMRAMSLVAAARPNAAAAPSAVLTGPAERSRVLHLLRAHGAKLRRRGVKRLRLFGSIARGEAHLASDVVLVAEIDLKGRKFSLLDLAGIELDLADLLGRAVQIVTAPEAMHPRIRRRVEAEAIEVFDAVP
jgi:predicted nucleotidyltransferase